MTNNDRIDSTKVNISNYERLRMELNGKDYFENPKEIYKSQEIYYAVLEENELDPCDIYEKSNDRINMLESVYSILQMLANNIELYVKVETEFTNTSAAYQYLQKRLKDLRDEIDRVKLDTHYKDESGNVSSITSYMFFNSRERGVK